MDLEKGPEGRRDLTVVNKHLGIIRPFHNVDSKVLRGRRRRSHRFRTSWWLSVWTTEKEGSYTVHNHGEQVSARCLNYQVGLHRGYQGKMSEDCLTSATLHQRERPPNREQRERFFLG